MSASALIWSALVLEAAICDLAINPQLLRFSDLSGCRWALDYVLPSEFQIIVDVGRPCSLGRGVSAFSTPPLPSTAKKRR